MSNLVDIAMKFTSEESHLCHMLVGELAWRMIIYVNSSANPDFGRSKL